MILKNFQNHSQKLASFGHILPIFPRNLANRKKYRPKRSTFRNPENDSQELANGSRRLENDSRESDPAATTTKGEKPRVGTWQARQRSREIRGLRLVSNSSDFAPYFSVFAKVGRFFVYTFCILFVHKYKYC